MSKENRHKPFNFIEKNEATYEPKDLYVLDYRFSLPITRNSYRKEKTEALHLDAKSAGNEGLYPNDLNKCVTGAYLLLDYAKVTKLESVHGMQRGEQEIDIDNYTAEWSFLRPDSDSQYTRSFVKCEQSWDIDMANPKELQENKVNFVVSIANEDKVACYKELMELFDKTKGFAKDVLVNEKDLVFEKDIDEKLKQAVLAIAPERKQGKGSLKPKSVHKNETNEITIGN